MEWLSYRTVTSAEALNRKDGEVVRLIGWVSERREHKDKIFMVLRDGSGYIQLVVPKDLTRDKSAIFDASLESALAAEGIIKSDPRAPGGKEVHVTDVKLIARADTWPITVSALKSPSFLFDMRHLTIRGRRARSIMKVRARLIRAAQEYFERRGYVWIQAPTFITSAVEGGATLFEVDYFGDKVYLTQSAQFYEEAAICSFEKVYTIQPSFRAEKSRTRKHLTEFWHIEAEVAFATHNDIMRVEEELVAYIVEKIAEDCQSELSALKVKLEVPRPPFPRITYDEALEVLERKGIKMRWGDDFGADEERILASEFETPFFVTSYPRVSRSFYHKLDPQDDRLTLSSDLMAPNGYGEITSGGERIEDYESLLESIRFHGLNPESYKWYLELRKYGMPPHSGFGLGVERMLRWVLKLDHIREACLFPRTPTRIYP